MAQPVYRIGIDTISTEILGLIRDENFKILDQKKIEVTPTPTLDEIIEHVVQLYHDLSKTSKSPVPYLGVAVASPVDTVNGIAKFFVAFGWKDIPLSKLLKERLKCEIHIENDVNAATLAEFHLGAGKGANSLYAFYPRVGLGGGYIQNGALVRGVNSTAAEIGHMVIQIDGPKCACGQRGCLEAIVSRRGFGQLFENAIQSGRTSRLKVADTKNLDNLVKAYRHGDEVVRDILTFQSQAMGIGLGNIINLTGVERIIIGGYIFHPLKDELLPIVKQYANDCAIGGGMEGVDIRLNELGEEAPALGATLLPS